MAIRAGTADAIRDQWERIAAGYDDHVTPLHLAMADDPLDRVGLRAGMRVLDVAAGSGALSIPAARRGAKVVATDIAPTMIDRLVRRAQAHGLADVDARVMDGCDLEFDDGSFDVAASQNGVSSFPDLARGLRELVRVTRPGGRVLIVALGPPPRAEFLSFFTAAMQAVVAHFRGLSMDPPPLPFQVADPETLGTQLSGAGLRDVTVEPCTWTMAIGTSSQLWEVVTHSSPSGAELVADLTDEQRDAVREVLDGMLREQAGGHRAPVLTARMNVGIGRR